MARVSPRRGRAWGLVALLMGLVVLTAGAQPALAIPAPIQVAGTGGQGVYIRPTPDTSQPAVGWMPEGASPDFNCFTYGQMIGNVNVWFSVNYNGATGYYASYYDSSSYRSEAELTAKYGVPKCGAQPPPAPPSVTLAQGPSAPVGYRYAITLNNFPANSSVSVSCRDSVSPNGFYTFSLNTNGSGSASTASYCYSGDGPEHWVIAGGVTSNRVVWGASVGGGAGATPQQPPPVGPTPGGLAPTTPTPKPTVAPS